MKREELEQLIEEHRSIGKMAKAVGVSNSTIRYWLRVWCLQSKGRLPKRQCKNCNTLVKRRPSVYCSSLCHVQFRRRVKVEANLNKLDGRLVKNYLLDLRGHRCEVCGISQWMGKPAPLELDHKDGNSSNNALDNIRLICPNCHSQTATYKGRNIGQGRYYRRERYAQGKSY
jgi:HNH endonuclease